MESQTQVEVLPAGAGRSGADLPPKNPPPSSDSLSDKPADNALSPRSPIPMSKQPASSLGKRKFEEGSSEAEGGLELLFEATLIQNHVQTNPAPDPKDVLCGRGGLINSHPGNIVFRKIVEYNKTIYQQIPKRDRAMVPQSIVQTIRNRGGRFLQSEGGTWVEISLSRATQKTSQALREKGNPGETDSSRDDSTPAAPLQATAISSV